MNVFNTNQAKEWLQALIKKEGLPEARLKSLRELISILDKLDWLSPNNYGSRIVWPALKAQTQNANIGKGSFLITLLPYYIKEEDNPSKANEPSALVARFARRNYYRELAKRLKRIVIQFAQKFKLNPKAFRLFVNSRLPEKLLAYGANLGNLGLNSLLYHPDYGSYFIIGLVYLPFLLEESKNEAKNFLSPQSFCQNCKICLNTCPTNALSQKNFASCLKAMFDKPVIWPAFLKEKWGLRFYGCDLCQEVCPHNRAAKEGIRITEGEIGPWVRLTEILTKKPTELKVIFRKTALGMSWLSKEALLRNALCAAGNGGYKTLLPLLKDYLNHPNPVIKDAAEFALHKIDEL